MFEEVGFIHLLTKEIWDGHPCCAFGISDEFIKQNPNTFAALYRAVLDRRGDGARGRRTAS